MKITAQELAIINYSINFSTEEIVHEGNVYYKPRTFNTLEEQQEALNILTKIKSCTENKDGQIVFIDSEIELSTTEKSSILKLIDRPFGISDIESKVSLYKKLQ